MIIRRDRGRVIDKEVVVHEDSIRKFPVSARIVKVS